MFPPIPGVPGGSDIFSMFLDALLGYFRSPGEQLLNTAIETLLRVNRPDFTAAWYVALYAQLFGLGSVIALVRGVFGAAGSLFRRDFRSFANALFLPLKQYWVVAYVPAVYAVVFVAFAKLSELIARLMPSGQGGGFNLGSVTQAAEGVWVFPLVVIVAVVFGAYTFLFQWAFPYAITLTFASVSGLAKANTRDGDKVYSAFFTWSLVSLAMQPAMSLAIVIIANIMVNVSSVTGSSLGYVLLLILAMWFVPKMLKKATSPAIDPLVRAMSMSSSIETSNNQMIRQKVEMSRTKHLGPMRRSPLGDVARDASKDKASSVSPDKYPDLASKIGRAKAVTQLSGVLAKSSSKMLAATATPVALIGLVATSRIHKAAQNRRARTGGPP